MSKPLRSVAPKDTKFDLKGVKSSSTSKLTLGDNPGVDYAPKAKAERDLVADHEIEKHADRVGNGDDVYKGKTKEAKFDKQKEGVYESKMKCESCGKMEESCSCGSSGKKKLLLSGKKGLSEVLTKNTTAGETINDFVHSKNKMFAGDSKKQRINRALGAYYGKHPEKKKVNEEPDFEFEMARNELATASRAVERLMKHLKGEGQLEAWVQSKITKGSDYLDTVADYMDSLKEESKQIDELSDKTYGDYVKGATRDLAKRQYNLGKGDLNDTRRLLNRRKGIDLAVDKLTKEDLAMPMLEGGKKKKKKMEKEQADVPMTYGASFGSPDGRV